MRKAICTAILGAALAFGFVAVPTAPVAAATHQATAVSIAKDIQATKAVAPWKGGKVPYSWGGGHGSKYGPSKGTCSGYTGPKPCRANVTTGVDCSGFTRWVYARAWGKDVLGAGNTDSQLARMHKVSKANAVAGDLVFFGTLSNTHHVGLYIGGGKMINASHTGTFIRTDSLGSDLVGYYHYS
ncbi:C40 family peptidase [Fodinicola feengrottensis]|uniref:NlpC/P60 domain-containing protein n=1 Tax=Fodinicola feengrottensis TaxID=435914 RepID=A0ABN2G6E0_9ACTN|nr:NlpC/P60 family protein [Fodinicola feengrottensis]